MIQLIILLFSFLTMTACTTHPVLPKTSDIKVSRETPGEGCEDLGFIEGRVKSTQATTEEALENMKEEAVKKGANYIKMETIGALGTSVRGQAYYCK